MYNVLIADDENTIRMALKKMICWVDFDCNVAFEARDGIEALDCMRENTVDIAIIDVRMPGLNGLQVCRLMQQERISTVVILLTAYTDFFVAQDALRLGVCDFVLKSSFEFELPHAIRMSTQKISKNHQEALSNEVALRPDSEYSEPINQLIVYLRENYAQRIKLSDLAAIVHLNQSYLCRLYKRQTGRTIMEDLIKYRLFCAKQLLAQGLTVEKAASESGFDSVTYFISLFKKYVGLGPGRYRKNSSCHNVKILVSELTTL